MMWLWRGLALVLLSVLVCGYVLAWLIAAPGKVAENLIEWFELAIDTVLVRFK
jgi:hypothetical protein